MPEAPQESSEQQDGRPEWARLHLWQIQWVRDVLVWLGLFGLILLGDRLSIVTVPLLLAVLAAYLFEPIVARLARPPWLSREGAAATVIALSAAIAVVPVVLSAFGIIQGVRLATTVSDKVTRVQAAYRVEPIRFDKLSPFPWPVARYQSAVLNSELRRPLLENLGHGAWRTLAERLIAVRDGPMWVGADTSLFGDLASWLPGVSNEDVDTAIKRSLTYVEANAETIAQQALSTGVSTGAGALGALLRTVRSIGFIGFSAFLTAFFFFFISTGWAKFRQFGKSLLPTRNRARILRLVSQMDLAIAGFIRGRLTIALIQSIVFTLGFWLIGVPAPLIIGPAIAVLSIVPYAALVGIPISITLLWLGVDQHTGLQSQWWWVLAAPIVVYFLGQALDDYVLTPLIQGKSTNMDTPTILFASIAGGALMGIYGLLVAIPLAACVKILAREIFWPRFRRWSEGMEADFLPIDDD